MDDINIDKSNLNSLDHPLEAGCSIAPTRFSLYISKWDIF